MQMTTPLRATGSRSGSRHSGGAPSGRSSLPLSALSTGPPPISRSGGSGNPHKRAWLSKQRRGPRPPRYDFDAMLRERDNEEGIEGQEDTQEVEAAATEFPAAIEQEEEQLDEQEQPQRSDEDNIPPETLQQEEEGAVPVEEDPGVEQFTNDELLQRVQMLEANSDEEDDDWVPPATPTYEAEDQAATEQQEEQAAPGLPEELDPVEMEEPAEQAEEIPREEPAGDGGLDPEAAAANRAVEDAEREAYEAERVAAQKRSQLRLTKVRADIAAKRAQTRHNARIYTSAVRNASSPADVVAAAPELILVTGKITPSGLDAASRAFRQPMRLKPWGKIDRPKSAIRTVPETERDHYIQMQLERCNNPQESIDIHRAFCDLQAELVGGRITSDEARRVAIAKLQISQWYGPSCAYLQRVLEQIPEGNDEFVAEVAEMAAAIALEGVEFSASMYHDRKALIRHIEDLQSKYEVVERSHKSIDAANDVLVKQVAELKAEIRQLRNISENLSVNRGGGGGGGSAKMNPPPKWHLDTLKSIEDWLAEMANYYMVTGLHEDRWTAYAVANTLGEAYSHLFEEMRKYLHQHDRKTWPWEEFCDFAKEAFVDEALSARKSAEVHSNFYRQAPRERTVSWLYRVRSDISLIKPGDRPSDGTQARIFRDGLQSRNLMEEVMFERVDGKARNWQTLEAIGQAALSVVATNPDYYGEPERRAMRGSKGGQKRKDAPSTSHGDWRGGKKPANVQQRQRQHQPQQQNTTRRSQPQQHQQRGPSGNSRAPTCSWCGRPGHRVEECRDKRRHDSAHQPREPRPQQQQQGQHRGHGGGRGQGQGSGRGGGGHRNNDQGRGRGGQQQPRRDQQQGQRGQQGQQQGPR